MGTAIRLLEERKKAKKILSGLVDGAEHVIVVHYSCESFYDRVDGTSPRITSIAVRNLGSGQTMSFSIHQVAESKHLLQAINEHYDDLEREMLDGFYRHVGNHQGHKWLHWNMRDVNYGFEAIAHRYRVLGGQPLEIPEPNLFDLSRLLINIYGIGYIGHPRLTKLIEKNNITKKDFMSGAQEAEAFEKGNFVGLHLSTLRKVDILENIAKRADQESLRTEVHHLPNFKLYPQLAGEFVKENWLAQLILAVIAIVGLIAIFH